MRRVAEIIGRKRLWKLISVVSGMLGATIAEMLMRAGYRSVRKDTAPASPFDPTDARFSWPEAVLWAAAAGVGLGVAKVLSARVAAIGWRVATGTGSPEVVEKPAV
jgi:hypothetical protein